MRFNYNNLALNKSYCVRTFGLDFAKIDALSNEVHKSIHSHSKYKAGRNLKLNALECTMLFLYYLKNNPTYEKLGFLFEVSTSTVYRYINTLIEVFDYSNLLDNLYISSNSSYLIVDGTETECERPKSNDNFINFYGRKKMFSIKTQVIVDPQTMKVVSVFSTYGSYHDFKVFKDTYNYLDIDKNTCILADAGYTGIQKIHSNSKCIIKREKYKSLTEDEILYNKSLSKIRVKVEHIIGKLKHWKIVGSLFRHCSFILYRFDRLFKIVSTLYNYSIS